MSFYRRIKYFLVHTLMLSNKEAQSLIESGQLSLDGEIICENCFLKDEQEIRRNGELVRTGKKNIYLKFNKPVGFQSSLNQEVPDNLASFFNLYEALAIAGRLDKASEGLLLLSNDGKWVEELCNPDFEKEKEYEVILNKKPDAAFLNAFSKGVKIGSYVTKACFCKLKEGNTIEVILKEGKNRQIRKMCKTLGYEVQSLKRLRIGDELLGNLKPGEIELIKI